MSTKTLNINTNGLLNKHFMKTNNSLREPASPTFSVASSYAWVTERSPYELKSIFKTTFNSLLEKEKDLKLAAEVGKTLLENNAVLEQKYNNLQDEFNVHQQESNEIYKHKLQDNQHTIHHLETQNAELLKKYEATLDSKEKISRQNVTSQQKLTVQVNELYQSLEQAYEKIQQYEDYRQDYVKKMIVKEIDIVSNEDTTSDYNELSNKIEHMMGQNQQLFKAKDNIQNQFHDTIIELKELQSQFTHVQQTKDQIAQLEDRFRYQESHIHQLTGLIEEYRLNLTNDCHHHQQQIPSLITSSSDEEEDDEDYRLPQHLMKNSSLHSELQLASTNDKNKPRSLNFEQDNMIVVADVASPRRNHRNPRQDLVIYPSLKIDDSLIVPVEPYRKRFTNNTMMVQHQPTGMLNRIVQVPFDSFYLVWRFFRFFIVIQLAMFIHILSHKK
ncbi:hypothetical protein BDF21DRAFT_489933 [Thamnidium elegans]|uniref:Uncharacterized protein n=1 Tax=Thamnidium elegans TaxID=101142 RepID=A0A8H7SYR4_9FUNG|nr:hypothetical protein INT48_001994 [Thamnidium elegans]KAI8094425.1 hypothetical protein BDF21DRAFT_489933 [Thamnidium elegans]